MSELYELPDGWEWNNLIDIVRIGCERGFKPTIIGDKVPFIGMTDIDKHTGRNTKYILEDNNKVSKGKTKFQKNAILLGKITPCTQNNKTTIVPDDIDGGYATTEVYALHCLEKIIPLYLNYYVRSKKINEYLVSSMIGATGRQRVPSDTVKNLNIPLPPLQEQKRIVSKLDTLFEKIDKAIALHQQNIDEVDVFMGSVLNEVFGELEEKYLPMKRFDTFTKLSRGHNPPKKDFIYEPKDGYIRFLQIRDGSSDKDAVYVPITKKLHLVTKDDLLLVAYRQVGKIFKDMEGAFNVALCKIMNNDKENLDTTYLYYLIQSKYVKGELLKRAERALIPSMSIEHLKSIEIPTPPLEIQQKTVKYLDQLSEKTEKVKSVQKEKMESLKALKASILDRAFRGEL